MINTREGRLGRGTRIGRLTVCAAVGYDSCLRLIQFVSIAICVRSLRHSSEQLLTIRT